MSGARYLLATRSAHKAGEIQSLLRGCGVEVVSLVDAGIAPAREEDDIEAFDTFRENALAKARYFAQRAGIAAIADDSGIMLAALAGEPGVRSRRYSGRDDIDGAELDRANNMLVAAKLGDLDDRTATYMCAAAVAYPDGQSCVTLGSCSGIFVTEPRGAGGFGYDPHFLLPARGLTFGEIDADEKLLVSHRARAFRALIPLL